MLCEQMTTLNWSSGTAYDFFISLYVLHHAGRFGLRASWAAGTRQRVSSANRTFLEKVQTFAPVPLSWVTSLPGSKDAEAALSIIAGLPAVERLPLLMTTPEMAASGVRDTLLGIAERGEASKVEMDFLRANYVRRADPLKPAAMANMIEVWSCPVESGARLLDALKEYYSVFFAEEESRIQPYLQQSLEDAQLLAGDLDLDGLLTHISRGVRFEMLDSTDCLTLVPSYWSAPLVFIARPVENESLLVFGARPENVSLVPGEDAPDGMVSALKALADPTRLKILRDLAVQPMTPAELARRLRLRPPTVVHHLRILRLAGLVEITVSAGSERMYAARLEAIEAVPSALMQFVRP